MIITIIQKNKKSFAVPFLGWASTASRLHSQYKEKVWFLPQIPQEFLVLICSISKKWKAGSTLELPNVFQPSNVFEL